MVIAMGNYAYFRIEHASYNREQWGYGRVAEAAHYAANQNKRGYVVTVGLPVFNSSYDARRAFLKLEQENTRKNGRLGDTLIVSLPKEVSEQHRLTMMERYLDRITFGGRIYAQAYEHRDHPDNPHFHVILVDRDRLTGKSVGHFGHSRSYRKKLGMEPNVTEWMRMQWEETGNEVFSEFGYSLTFDRRSNLERGLEPAGEHRGYQNDNHIVETTELVAPDHTPEDGNMIQPQEEAMEDVAEFERPHDADISEAAYRIRQIHSDTVELNRIRNARKAILEADARIESLKNEKANTEDQQASYFDEAQRLHSEAVAAEQHANQYRNENGKLRGIRFSIFGFTYKSRQRTMAEAAVAHAGEKLQAASRIPRIMADYQRRLESLSNQIEVAEENALLKRNDLLGVNGSLEDLHKAEEIHAADIDKLIRGDKETKPIDPWEAGRAWEEGELTDDELRSYCICSGNKELLAELEEALEEERSLAP